MNKKHIIAGLAVGALSIGAVSATLMSEDASQLMQANLIGGNTCPLEYSADVAYGLGSLAQQNGYIYECTGDVYWCNHAAPNEPSQIAWIHQIWVNKGQANCASTPNTSGPSTFELIPSSEALTARCSNGQTLRTLSFVTDASGNIKTVGSGVCQ